MSILLEALRQKNKLAVTAERLKQDASNSNVMSEAANTPEQQLSDMESLVAALAIKKPNSLDWQLSHHSVSDDVPLTKSSEANLDSPFSLATTNAPTETPQPVEMDSFHHVMEMNLEPHAIPEDDHTLDELFPLVDEHNLVVPTQTDTIVADLVEKDELTRVPLLSDEAIKPITENTVGMVEDFDAVHLQEKVAAANQYLKINRQTNRSPLSARLSAKQLKLSPPVFGKNLVMALLGGGLATSMIGYIAWQAWQDDQAELATQLVTYQHNVISSPIMGSVDQDKLEPIKPVENEVPIAINDRTTPTSNNAVSRPSIVTQKPTRAIKVDDEVKRSSYAKPKEQNINDRKKTEMTGVFQTVAVSDMLLSAWNSWQQGDVVSAEKAYRRVLEKQPNQRDALMGMLAVTQLQTNTLSQAHDIAARLEAVYPHDAEVAEAIRLFKGNSTSQSDQETQLKLLLKQDNQNAMTAYQLGVVYAEQKRWPEAQNAFFNAASLDGSRPEYLANLAISYDQLGKTKLAISAYDQALQLANKKPSTVNVELLNNRLKALQMLITEGED